MSEAEPEANDKRKVILITDAALAFREAQNDIMAFLELSRVPPGTPPEKAANFKRIKNDLSIVSLVDLFLAYVNEILSQIFRQYPDRLKTDEKLPYSEILKHDSMETLRESIIEAKIHSLSYKSFREVIQYLKSHMGFDPYAKEPDLIDFAVEAIEIRNSITHNKGIVNSIFLKKAPSTSFKLGERCEFSDVEMIKFLFTLTYCCATMDRVAIEHFKLPARQDEILTRVEKRLGLEPGDSIEEKMEAAVYAITSAIMEHPETKKAIEDVTDEITAQIMRGFEGLNQE